MNEQIKQLAVQAWKYANETVGYREFGYLDAFEQKFAELIVHKCMAICDEQKAYYFGERMATDDFIDKNMCAEAESTCDILRYKMKKHFGVEE